MELMNRGFYLRYGFISVICLILLILITSQSAFAAPGDFIQIVHQTNRDIDRISSPNSTGDQHVPQAHTLKQPILNEINTMINQAGILVTPTSGLVTTEDGDIDTFMIVLGSQPTKAVQIGLSSSDPTEGTVSPSQVTFNGVNWNIPQTVTVTGMNDDIKDGDQAYWILLAPAKSNDESYEGLKGPDVSVTNMDNDITPIAQDDQAVTEMNQPVTTNVLANDGDLVYPPFTVTVITLPAHGVAVVNEDNRISYIPEADFTGTDVYQYQVCDDRGGCSSAQVSITVIESPDQIIALNDTYTMDQDSVLQVPSPGVLGNDHLPAGESVIVSLIQGPQYGTLSLETNGAITFSPPPSFVGEVTFIYVVANESQTSNEAVVQIQVIDTVDPEIEWLHPIGFGGVFDVGDEIVHLLVQASDNVAIERVRFFRWDAINEVIVEMGSVFIPPYELIFPTADLNPEWNQIFAKAYDTSSNASEADFIWLYHTSTAEQLFLPVVLKEPPPP
jgi:hypothetical protein